MKARKILALAVMLIAAAAGAAAQTSGLKLPPSKKIKLPNGLTVILVERHTVPMVYLYTIVKASAVNDPPGKDGVASLTAALLRKGTKTRTADKFSEELDFIGGSFNAFAGSDSTVVSSEFMKKDIAKGLDLYTDVLMNPTFPAEEVTKLVKQRTDAIKAAKDQAGGIIATYFNAYLFGKHPYGRPTGGDEKSLAAMTRDDIAAFYQAHYAPGNAILAVAGDFSTAEMEKTIADRFGAWPTRRTASAPLADPAPYSGKKLLLIDKPDSTQTYYMIGNVGVARTNPDRVYLRVVNTLFGGRFTSMLNSELRIKSGLTYGAGSSFDQRKVRGPFVISTYTVNDKTEKAMDMTLDVLKRLHEKGFTQEELDSAKAYIKGQVPTSLETSDQLASQFASLEFYGLDESEINNLFASIDKMTLEDAKRVIQQYYPLDNLVFVVIGKASEIGPVVKKYAPKVDTRTISEPGFGQTAAGAGRTPE